MIVGAITNEVNVQVVSPAEESIFPQLQGNTLLQMSMIMLPTDLNDDLKAKAEAILAAAPASRYAEYARTYLAIDALLSPRLHPQALADARPDYGAIVAQYGSFDVGDGLIRAAYLHYKGEAQLLARDGLSARNTLCQLLNEMPVGMHSLIVARNFDQMTGGLVAWYLLDEGLGAVARNVVCNGTDGQLVGQPVPTWVAGLHGKALSFGGSGSGHILVPDNVKLASIREAMTVAVWVKTSANASGTIIDKRNADGSAGSYRLSLIDGHVEMQVFNNNEQAGVTGSTVIADDKWHHVAGVYDGAHLQVFVDGHLDASVTASGTIAIVPASLFIGRAVGGGSFPDVIDDIRIYNRALDADDLRDLFEMDADADGLSNAAEINIYGTNPTKEDTDGDGTSDGDEIIIHQTNPLDPNSNHTTPDVTPPTITCPSGQTILPQVCGAGVAFDEATATDNRDSEVQAVCTPQSGAVLAAGLHTVNCSATDASGNTGTCSFTVDVKERLQVRFVAPLSDDNADNNTETDADVVNTFKVGSRVIHKVKLFDCAGNDVTEAYASLVSVKLDVTLRTTTNAGTEVVNDVPEVSSGVGNAGGLMIPVGDHFQYNLDTTGYTAGTVNDERFYRSAVTVEWVSAPGLVVGEEDALLESKP
jgi:hypothetical protein